MFTNLTIKSRNVKTGPIPVSTTSSESCPPECPLQGAGCYAELGHVGMFWRKVSQGKTGTNFDTFISKIAALPAETLWRHNQAGDLIGSGGNIDTGALAELVAANIGRRGFTYSHYDVLKNTKNAVAIAAANKAGFTVNLSANNLDHADKLADLGIAPVVVVLPAEQTTNTKTPLGRKIVVCPATIRENISCKTCQLCQRNRDASVGFPVHGTSKKRAAIAAQNYGVK